MTIDYSTKTLGQWQDLLSHCSQANWLQAWPYAMASFHRDHYRTKLGTIKRKNSDGAEEVIGIFAIQEIKLGPLHFVNLSRGPLWFAKDLGIGDYIRFCAKMAKEYPSRLLRRRRFMLESDARIFTSLEQIESFQKALRALGFKLRKETYHTVWLDLSKELKDLRASLHGKWRNALVKSERENLKIEIKKVHFQESRSEVDQFLYQYELYKQSKVFVGPSALFMQYEILEAAKLGNAYLLTASKDSKPVAGLFIERHGQNISYRLGWNSVVGRQTNAHNLLLWSAIRHFKEMNVKSFDLGGILPNQAKALTLFKTRTGGIIRSALGIFS